MFAFGALAWTAGAIVAPGVFTLPLDLYLVPVLVFLACKAFFGPVLYRARVDCSWADVLGASLASMGLSHAIARGVFAGLVRRNGTFHRTAKGTNGAAKRAAPAREEALMLAALALAVARRRVALRHRPRRGDALGGGPRRAGAALRRRRRLQLDRGAERAAEPVAVPQPAAELAPVRVAA